MCYVDTQWYDISCATLYITDAFWQYMCYSAIKYGRMEPYLISEEDGFQTIK